MKVLKLLNPVRVLILKLKFEKKEKERKEKGEKTEQNFSINDEEGESSYTQFPDDEESDSVHHSYFLEMTIEQEIEQCKKTM